MPNYFKKLTLAAALAALGTVTAVPASAIIALEEFDFNGTCSDCIGNGVGTLFVIAGYTPGTPLDTDNFYSFTYSSSILSGILIGHNSSDLAVSGSLPAILPGPATVSISDDLWSFTSSTGGAWSVNSADYGTSSAWSSPTSPTPEPRSVSLLLAAILVIALVARKRSGGASNVVPATQPTR